MQPILKLFWDLCCLRIGPQDLPYSKSFLILVVLLNVLVNVGQMLLQFPLLTALQQEAWMLAVTIGFTVLVLHLRNLRARWVQTTTSLIGSGTLINLIVLPFIVFQYFILPKGDPMPWFELLRLLNVMIILGINLWIVFITIHIFKAALDLPTPAASIITLGYIAAHFLAYNYLSGGAVAA